MSCYPMINSIKESTCLDQEPWKIAGTVHYLVTTTQATGERGNQKTVSPEMESQFQSQKAEGTGDQKSMAEGEDQHCRRLL